jgi:hypothetical protein
MTCARRRGLRSTSPPRACGSTPGLTATSRGRCAGGRAALALLGDSAPAARSDLEILFLELIRAAGLPEPSVNVVVIGDVVDFCWPEYNLVVEVDSWEYHRLRRPFEEDKRRGNRLELAHVMVLRYTDKVLREEPDRVIAELRAAMAR